ncbi:Tequila [Strongyloides ratti]|uniref:Tequila n=1 Tax=Strongyloides ratti TaxID=34506 RepID=A0A090LMM7_STRRB|nr:Tequila [Strongyloides ratti]CEF71095.1 Tequila [Strongyloides ratti]
MFYSTKLYYIFLIYFSLYIKIYKSNWIQSSLNKFIYLPEVYDFDISEKFNINEARNYCSNLGGKLISFTDSDLNIDFKNYYLTTFITSAIYQKGIWKWDDQRIVSSHYNITTNIGRCLSFLPKNKIFTSVDCNDIKNALPLCEKNIAITCQLENGQYFGNISITKNNITCLKWNDNSLLVHGILFDEQLYWDHNYCRNPIGYTKKNAWCLVEENKYEECQIPYCNLTLPLVNNKIGFDINSNLNDVICGEGSLPCNFFDNFYNYSNNIQCIPKEFWCDYQKDCDNGMDEYNCENWLNSFVKIGSYKIIRNISYIWSNIFHEQSCAKKCLESYERNCNSFSFNYEDNTCILSNLNGNDFNEKKWNKCDGIKCQLNGKCIDVNNICNQNNDCYDNEDENFCYDSFKINFIPNIVTKNFEEGILTVYLGSLNIPLCLSNIPTTIREKICPNFVIRPYIGDKEKKLKLGSICYKGECYLDKNLNCIEKNNLIRCNDICGRLPNISSAIRLRCPRIIGGCSAKPNESPWTAAIRLKNPDSHHCGSVIISEYYLLTAAHCVSDIEKNLLYIRVGDYDNKVIESQEMSVEIENITIHPSYQNIFKNDIAIIKLSEKLNFTDSVKPICLPPINYKFEKGHQCVISGFGQMDDSNNDNEKYSQFFQIATIPILNLNNCKMNSYNIHLDNNTICAGYESGNIDACHGDSGGPLVCMYEGIYYLAGIVSWGEGCGKKNSPGIYTSVSSYILWIENITKTLF